MPRAIVLAFDRLSRRCLGCFGHEWIETPNLDRLAARSIVFDQHFVSPDWRNAGGSINTIGERLRDQGFEVRVLNEVASDAASANLNEQPLARLIESACAELTELSRTEQRSWLLWLSSAGIDWPCLALETFAELYADELDQEGEGDSEIDSVREAEVAYAACVTQLDHLVGRLLNTIEEFFGDDPPLLIVTAFSGESLGESEPLPLTQMSASPLEFESELRDEFVHVPLIVNTAMKMASAGRRQELTVADDLIPTLVQWFGCEVTEDSSNVARSWLPLIRNEPISWRESLILRETDGSTALRTSDCLLVRPASPEITPMRLYLKPEDTWEVNDVAEQHENLVAELSRQLVGQ